MSTYKLRVRLNAGAWTTGGVTAALGDTVSLSPDSAVGITSYRYEIFDYPDGFALPSGWSEENGVYFSTASTPPDFTLDAAEWGKYALRLTVNGGLSEQIIGRTTAMRPDPRLIDEDSAISVPSPAGLVGLMQRERNQFGGRDWTRQINEDLKLIDAAMPTGGADATAIRGIPIDASVAAAGAPEDTYGLTYSHGTGFVLAAGGSGGGYATIQNNGTPVTTRTILNLPTGCGLVAADDTVSKTTLTVSGLTTTHLSATAGILASQLAAGASGTVMVGGSPNSFSASPSVTSLTASGFVAAGGGTLPGSGAIRLATASKVAWAGTGTNTVGWNGDLFEIHAGATKLLSVGASTVAIEAAATLGFAAGITTPTITQAAVADAVGQDLTVRAQGNNSAASAAGNLVLGGGVNAGAGADGVTQVMYGATRVAEFGAGYLGLGTAPGSGTTACAATGTLRMPYGFRLFARNVGDTADVEVLQYGAASASQITLWNGTAGVGISASNVVTLFAAGGIALANGVTANSSITASGTVQGAGLTSSAANVQWSNGVNGILRIFPRTSGTPNKLTIQGQDNTGGAGGDVLFRAGQGTTSDGNIALHADPTAWLSAKRAMFWGKSSAVPTAGDANGAFVDVDEDGDVFVTNSAGIRTQAN